MLEQKIIRPNHPWGLTTGTRILNIMCSDGVQRIFTSTAEADTFFTTPGRVKVKGKTVSGHAYHDNMLWHDEYPDGIWKFTAYSYRKNGAILPDWKKECTECHNDIERGEEVHTFSYYYYHQACLTPRNASYA